MLEDHRAQQPKGADPRSDNGEPLLEVKAEASDLRQLLCTSWHLHGLEE